MPLSANLRAWFERFYPGLIASIEALDLGKGAFREKEFKVRTAGEGAICGIKLGLEYVLNDRHVIQITERLALKDGRAPYRYAAQVAQLGDWEAYYYALRCKNPSGDCIFGFDLHELVDDAGQSRGNQHHVHFEVHKPIESHTLAEEFVPDPRNMDPRQFVSRIVDYRRTKTLPVSRKKKT